MMKKSENGIVFNNGNINLHFTSVDIEMIKDNSMFPFHDDFTVLQDCLFWMDIYFTGEETYYFDKQGWILYSYNTEKEYEIFSDDIEKLMEGKTIKLYARKAREETIARMEER